MMMIESWATCGRMIWLGFWFGFACACSFPWTGRRGVVWNRSRDCHNVTKMNTAIGFCSREKMISLGNSATFLCPSSFSFRRVVMFPWATILILLVLWFLFLEFPESLAVESRSLAAGRQAAAVYLRISLVPDPFIYLFVRIFVE